MKLHRLLLTALFLPALALNHVTADSIPTTAVPSVIVHTNQEPIASGKFQPTWASLEQYQAPDWYRNAKFGIWAHWGPQCQAEDGDWYDLHG